MKIILIAAAAIPLAMIPTYSFAQPPDKQAQIARGKYLADQVAKCADCHSPLNERGQPLPGKEYRGAILSFKSITPMPVWAEKAPNIAGLPGWQTKDAVKFLMTGIAYNDLPARPPMPQFRLNREDAEAVVAYLKSLRN
jgi:mono/diheme cytochrome c family protein